jgi:hypothetical protein
MPPKSKSMSKSGDPDQTDPSKAKQGQKKAQPTQKDTDVPPGNLMGSDAPEPQNTRTRGHPHTNTSMPVHTPAENDLLPIPGHANAVVKTKRLSKDWITTRCKSNSKRTTAMSPSHLQKAQGRPLANRNGVRPPCQENLYRTVQAGMFILWDKEPPVECHKKLPRSMKQKNEL